MTACSALIGTFPVSSGFTKLLLIHMPGVLTTWNSKSIGCPLVSILVLTKMTFPEFGGIVMAM